ncbi:response regulator [Natronospirillum operosum]|uniref:Response regulator n=2 Tax=Natronospirillum operosum TaxID=2759953 RepID=A0A4Z0WF87_9GAMM|nr:response regulator [Natronospirillum operosum]
MSGLRKILYVEDDVDIQMIARLSLETVGGYDLMLCDSGAEALTQAAGYGPDLLLLDMMLPDMDGPETLSRLRADAQLSSVPAVFLTARTDAWLGPAWRDQGVIGVLRKPFDPMTLPEQVGALWAEWCSQ